MMFQRPGARAGWALALALFSACAVRGQGIVSTVAGNSIPGAYSGDGGPAVAAQLVAPRGLARDQAGNLYVADGPRIRKIAPDGTITTVAGNGSYDATDASGPATSLPLAYPSDVAVDQQGNLYISLHGTHRIRKVTSSGIVSTIAGMGSDGTRHMECSNGPGMSAQLFYPSALVTDPAGNLFIADTQNGCVRKLAPDGTLTTIAGGGYEQPAIEPKPATTIWIGAVEGLALDQDGTLYIGSRFAPITKRTPDGNLSLVAGGGRSNADNIPATQAEILLPSIRIALDGAGNLYFIDGLRNLIRKVDRNGILTTVVGNGDRGLSGDNGLATSARLSQPDGIVADATGVLYISDTGNSRIRKVNASGIISTMAGFGRGYSYEGDGGLAIDATLLGPSRISMSQSGEIYFVDGSQIRRVDRNGIIGTFAGNGNLGSGVDGGPVIKTESGDPAGMVFDAAGNFYFSDARNHKVFKIDRNKVITAIAGDGVEGFSGDNGLAVHAQLAYPRDVAVDRKGNIYIADARNVRIRKIAPNGIITTVAGSTRGLSGDDGPAITAQLDAPLAIAVDGLGSLYIADYGNKRIRKVTPEGIMRTIAGGGSNLGENIPAVSADIGTPDWMAIDGAGRLYIPGAELGRVRRVDVSGRISTIAGTTPGFSGDGGPALSAQFGYLWGGAVDAAGSVYVTDLSSFRIRKIAADANAITLTTVPEGLTVIADGVTLTTPVTMSWAPGTTHTLSIARGQLKNGVAYGFSSWSQGGPATQTVTMPAGFVATTYAATFLRPSVGIAAGNTWYIDLDGNGQWDGPTVDRLYTFGVAGSTPVLFDVDRDGAPDFGYYKDGQWRFDLNGNGVDDGPAVDRYYQFGFLGALPVIGDFNGDGQPDFGVYAEGKWYLDLNGNGLWDGPTVDRFYQFGFPKAVPVAADVNGDGRTDLGVYFQGDWYFDLNGDGLWNGPQTDRFYHFGFAGALPVVGDFNADGKLDFGIYLNGDWYLDLNNNGLWEGNGIDRSFHFGFAGPTPVAGLFP